MLDRQVAQHRRRRDAGGPKDGAGRDCAARRHNRVRPHLLHRRAGLDLDSGPLERVVSCLCLGGVGHRQEPRRPPHQDDPVGRAAARGRKPRVFAEQARAEVAVQRAGQLDAGVAAPGDDEGEPGPTLGLIRCSVRRLDRVDQVVAQLHRVNRRAKRTDVLGKTGQRRKLRDAS